MKINVDPNESIKDKAKGAWSKTKTWVSNKLGEVKRWTEDHWIDVLKGLPYVLSAVAGAIKIVKMIKGSAADRHEDRMDKTYYDPATGLHWELKRNLKNSERIALVQRKRNGENVEDILISLHVLKK